MCVQDLVYVGNNMRKQALLKQYCDEKKTKLVAIVT